MSASHPILDTFTPVSEIQKTAPKYSWISIRWAVFLAMTERLGWSIVGGFWLPVLVICIGFFALVSWVLAALGIIIEISAPGIQHELARVAMESLGLYGGYVTPVAIYYFYAKPLTNRLYERRSKIIKFDKTLNDNLMRVERILKNHPGDAARKIIDRIMHFYLKRAGAKQSDNVTDEGITQTICSILDEHPLTGSRADQNTDDIIRLTSDAEAAGDAGVSLLNEKPTKNEMAMARFLAAVTLVILAILPSMDPISLGIKSIVAMLVIMHVLDLKEAERLSLHGFPAIWFPGKAAREKIGIGDIYFLTRGYRKCPGINLFTFLKEESPIYVIVAGKTIQENQEFRVDDVDELCWLIRHCK